MSSYSKPDDFHEPTAAFVIKLIERKARQWMGVARGRNFAGRRRREALMRQGEAAMAVADAIRMELTHDA